MNQPTKVFPERLRDLLCVEPPPRYACQACAAVTYFNESDDKTWDIAILAFGDGYACELFIITCHSCKTPIFPVVISPATKLQALPVPAPQQARPTTKIVTVSETPRKLTPAEILAGKGRK